MDDRPLADARRLGTRLRSAWGFAAQGLGSARQRALLALLGVTIGVAAVVALVSLGKGIERQALSEFETMGTQVISVMLTDRDPGLPVLKVSATMSQRKPLDSEALVAAVAGLPEVELASEVASLSCQESAATHHSLHAVRPDLARILGLKLASGRFIHALDRHELWVVLGAELARQLGEGGHRIEPGAVLALCGRAMRVAGVLAPMSVSEAVVPVSLDQALMVSARAGRRIDPQTVPSQLAQLCGCGRTCRPSSSRRACRPTWRS